ncbi:MAG: hypothetical protein JXB07_10115, partial [Anaerolineae bacterium]|nr:hypothetical protein [Anaerolineae bacterium]
FAGMHIKNDALSQENRLSLLVSGQKRIAKNIRQENAFSQNRVFSVESGNYNPPNAYLSHQEQRVIGVQDSW